MRRRVFERQRKKVLVYRRFYPAGDYTFTVPYGCSELDVFLVGGGAGGGNGYAAPAGGGSGYTKTYKKSNVSSGSYNDWVKDGDAIPVTYGMTIQVHVGAGGIGGISTSKRNPKYGSDGGGSFIIVNGIQYTAEGGKAYKGEVDSAGIAICASGGTGATRGGGWGLKAPASYSDGIQPPEKINNVTSGTSQGHTTRDFGEIEFQPNAGGTSGAHGSTGKEPPFRSTGHSEGSGQDGSYYSVNDTYPYSEGGAGYGGGGGAGGIYEISGQALGSGKGGDGGDGTVVIRFYKYE